MAIDAGIAIGAVEAAVAVCESLLHPRHADLLRRIRRPARRVLKGFFAAQKLEVLRELDAGIKSLVEADSKDRRLRAESLIPFGFAPIRMPINAALGSDWDEVLARAITNAGTQIAEELGATGPSLGFAVQYIRENSLQRVGNDLASETVRQLRDAIADAYGENATYGEIVKAIEDTYANFSASRANTIAQTELNTAYNASRHDIAATAGFGEKRWATESDNPCLRCIGNEAEGWIPIGQAFISGDMLPTAHPNCYCSVDYRSVEKGD